MTYRDAVDRSRSLIQGRADVRIDWDGRRGPRDDARIIFTKVPRTGELRVRFRSTSQLLGFTRIIASERLLVDHHGVWYPCNKVITAPLVGDYDQFHAAVAWALVPKQKNPTFARDSPFGR